LLEHRHLARPPRTTACRESVQDLRHWVPKILNKPTWLAASPAYWPGRHQDRGPGSSKL